MMNYHFYKMNKYWKNKHSNVMTPDKVDNE